MNYKIERTEQYAHIQPKEDYLNESNVADLEKIVRELYRQGYTNMILNFSGINELDGYGVSLIRKATKICVNESGLFVIVTKNPEITERLDNAKIEELTIMRTPEEAVDAISLNELENDFRQEEDEFGFGEFSEGGGEEDY